MRLKEKIHDVTFHLDVEANYNEPPEGKGKKDAVIFTMGQYVEYTDDCTSLDASVSTTVEDARAFAEAILKTCDEIEREELREEPFVPFIERQPRKEAEPKCTITLLEKEHLPGAFIAEVVTPKCTRTIHHYSDKSRAEYVDDLVRQLELSDVSYVVNKSEGEKQND